MTRWTHALRRPGPTPDRCTAEVDDRLCGCDVPDAPPFIPDAEHVTCEMCDHELVAAVSGRPSDSPEPPR